MDGRFHRPSEKCKSLGISSLSCIAASIVLPPVDHPAAKCRTYASKTTSSGEADSLLADRGCLYDTVGCICIDAFGEHHHIDQSLQCVECKTNSYSRN